MKSKELEQLQKELKYLKLENERIKGENKIIRQSIEQSMKVLKNVLKLNEKSK